jgi:hypothetical protein
MPWIINEDRALKAKFAGIRVQDSTAPPEGRPVGVRFRLPETEMADLNFPLIVIEHQSIERDPEREHRGGPITLPYAPEGLEWWADQETDPDALDPSKSPYEVPEFPVPYNIDYVVTVYSRDALHNVQIAAELARNPRIPGRFGFLEIPEDGTIRRIDMLGGPELSTRRDENGKRIFQQHYVLRVSTELLPSDIKTLARVIGVDIDLKQYSDVYG